MSDLVEFLRGRLDEEEAAARAFPGWGSALGDDPGFWEHVERWDPARVLAEIAAKRRILDLHPAVSQPSGSWCATCGDWPQPGYEQAMVQWPCATLHALALPYADHSDFDAAWKSPE